jgi:hypothetical protein
MFNSCFYNLRAYQTRSNSISDFSALTHSHPITIKNHPGSHECHGGRALAKPPVVTVAAVMDSWAVGRWKKVNPSLGI